MRKFTVYVEWISPKKRTEVLTVSAGSRNAAVNRTEDKLRAEHGPRARFELSAYEQQAE